ncbi:tripartite motif-containing protein 2-like isoform X1 [Littorina saxatilis]|uniref:tripartite motif-containing protein 2-like isoform X1 n=1 Tax=Littorina saxatilis TaxID=31220 RepID=UPI0038B45F3C
MSTLNLRNRIEEDHLTCTICFQPFTRPKALPCLHTFCEHCLREYVVSRGYEPSGEFPCPICRVTVKIPSGGVDQFADNHLVQSLSHTVDNTKVRPQPVVRPTPKPRRSLQPKTDDDGATGAPPPYTPTPFAEGGAASSAAGCYGGMEGGGGVGQPQHPPPRVNPPPFAPPGYNFNPQTGYNPPPYYPPPVNYPGPSPSYMHVGGNPVPPTSSVQPGAGHSAPNPYPAPLLYPTIPPPSSESGDSCSKGLQLKFGKKGASVTDFHKPFGLAISDACDFIVTDVGGNRIFVFNYRGEPKKAFHCDSRIKDVAVNSKNEILVVVNKPGAALICYDMSGRYLGEHGKFITHEETQGISPFINGGAVITGIQNHSVYIMTDQYKLSSKFGRKGTGDGYFQSPAFVATDSKNHIIVSDNVNHNVQVFNSQGKFKVRFGSKGSAPGQLFQPMGVVATADDNIIVADTGNCRVEMFTSKGAYTRTVVSGTHQLGEDVRPVNVAMTPRGDVAVLLKGNYFAEVRVYNPYTSASSGHDPTSVKDSATCVIA